MEQPASSRELKLCRSNDFFFSFYPSQKRHHVLQTVHPSPLSVNRGFFGCRHFSKTNELLKKSGKKPIDWRALWVWAVGSGGQKQPLFQGLSRFCRTSADLRLFSWCCSRNRRPDSQIFCFKSKFECYVDCLTTFWTDFSLVWNKNSFMLICLLWWENVCLWRDVNCYRLSCSAFVNNALPYLLLLSILLYKSGFLFWGRN